MAADPETPAGTGARTSPRPLRHIPALDGLRAVAVVGVMLFHGGVSWAPGGFLGVDVFFVLSGYLITTLLLRERVGEGHIDLRAFWVRRLRRLLPALLLLLAAIGIAAPFLVEPVERANVRGDGLAALGYVANWRFIVTEQSYFAGVPSPLRHLWSLAVEEQWYVVFPVVVAVALRGARRVTPLLAGLVVAAVASALWMAHMVSGTVDPSRAYYGTDSRAHSLLVGAILAVVAAQWPLHRYRRTLAGAGLVGATGVVAAYALVQESDTWMYRGGFLALAALSAALVAGIALPRPDLPLARVLAARPLVAIGKVSYGLYLWHWPVNVALTPRRTGLDGSGWWQEPALLALRTAVAVAVTVASYHLVEVPVRRRGLDGLRLRVPGLRRSRPAAVAMCGALVVWLLVAGTLRVPDGGAATQAAGLDPRVAAAPRGVPEQPPEPVPTIPAEIRAVIEANGIPPVPADRPVRVLSVGDSVAFTLSFENPVVPPSLEVASGAIVGCGIVDGFALPDGRIDPSAVNCGDWALHWQNLAADSQPDVALVQFGAWEVFDHKVGRRTVRSGTREMAELMRVGFDRGVAALLAVKPDVRFMFLGVPCMHEEDLELGGGDSARNDPERVAWVNGVIEGYARDLGDRATYVDLGELVCPGGELRDQVDGVPLQSDGLHYTQAGTGPVWRWLAERIVPFAQQPIEAPAPAPAPADGRADGAPTTPPAAGAGAPPA
ncbi:MAG TPA: acyltransferase [Acidimicrobiales bacterium]|nr:acyltransferase [Acidimicrobiales bacterium]